MSKRLHSPHAFSPSTFHSHSRYLEPEGGIEAALLLCISMLPNTLFVDSDTSATAYYGTGVGETPSVAGATRKNRARETAQPGSISSGACLATNR